MGCIWPQKIVLARIGYRTSSLSSLFTGLIIYVYMYIVAVYVIICNFLYHHIVIEKRITPVLQVKT